MAAKRRSNRERRRKLAKAVADYKASRPCHDCKRHFNPWQMHFDHIDATSKDDDVARLVNRGATRKVWAEIEKCELVCANCHADRTYQRASAKRVGSP